MSEEIKCCWTCLKHNKSDCPFEREQFHWCDSQYWVASEKYAKLEESNKKIIAINLALDKGLGSFDSDGDDNIYMYDEDRKFVLLLDWYENEIKGEEA